MSVPLQTYSLDLSQDLDHNVADHTSSNSNRLCCGHDSVDHRLDFYWSEEPRGAATADADNEKISKNRNNNRNTNNQFLSGEHSTSDAGVSRILADPEIISDRDDSTNFPPFYVEDIVTRKKRRFPTPAFHGEAGAETIPLADKDSRQYLGPWDGSASFSSLSTSDIKNCWHGNSNSIVFRHGQAYHYNNQDDILLELLGSRSTCADDDISFVEGNVYLGEEESNSKRRRAYLHEDATTRIVGGDNDGGAGGLIHLEQHISSSDVDRKNCPIQDLLDVADPHVRGSAESQSWCEQLHEDQQNTTSPFSSPQHCATSYPFTNPVTRQSPTSMLPECPIMSSDGTPDSEDVYMKVRERATSDHHLVVSDNLLELANPRKGVTDPGVHLERSLRGGGSCNANSSPHQQAPYGTQSSGVLSVTSYESSDVLMSENASLSRQLMSQTSHNHHHRPSFQHRCCTLNQCTGLPSCPMCSYLHATSRTSPGTTVTDIHHVLVGGSGRRHHSTKQSLSSSHCIGGTLPQTFGRAGVSGHCFQLPRSPTARAAIILYPFPPVSPHYLPDLRHSHHQAVFSEFLKIETDPLRIQLGHFIVEHCTRSIPEELFRSEVPPDPRIISDFVDQVILAVEIFGEHARYNNGRDPIPSDINELYISKWLQQKQHQLLKPLEIIHHRRQQIPGSGAPTLSDITTSTRNDATAGKQTKKRVTSEKWKGVPNPVTATRESPSTGKGIKARRKIGVSLGEELDRLGVPRIINCENLRQAIANRGLVVQLPTHSGSSSRGGTGSYYQKTASHPSRLPLFNLLIAGRGDTRRSRLILPWGDVVKIKYNRTLLGIPDFLLEALGYGGGSNACGLHHLVPKVCAVSLEDSAYGVEILLFYRGMPCNKRSLSRSIIPPNSPSVRKFNHNKIGTGLGKSVCAAYTNHLLSGAGGRNLVPDTQQSLPPDAGHSLMPPSYTSGSTASSSLSSSSSPSLCLNFSHPGSVTAWQPDDDDDDNKRHSFDDKRFTSQPYRDDTDHLHQSAIRLLDEGQLTESIGCPGSLLTGGRQCSHHSAPTAPLLLPEFPPDENLLKSEILLLDDQLTNPIWSSSTEHSRRQQQPTLNSEGSGVESLMASFLLEQSIKPEDWCDRQNPSLKGQSLEAEDTTSSQTGVLGGLLENSSSSEDIPLEEVDTFFLTTGSLREEWKHRSTNAESTDSTSGRPLSEDNR